MTSKRVILGAYDALSLLVISAVAYLTLAQPAFAYVDPSIMTYTIQALAGVAVALSTVFAVAFRRVRKKQVNLQGIDENANKEVEGKVQCTADAQVLAQADEQARAYKRGDAARKKGAGKISLSRRIVMAVLVSAFFAFTIFFVAPVEIVFGNSGGLMLSAKSLWPAALPVTLVVFAVLAIVLSCLRGRAFNIVLLIVFSLGLAAYLQAFLLNGVLPIADGRDVDWGIYWRRTAASCVMWVVVIAAPLILSHFFRSGTRVAATLLSVLLVIMQAVGVGSLMVSPAASSYGSAEGAGASYPNDGFNVTEEGLFDVSDKSNVVVFVLDTYDTKMLQQAVADRPGMLDDFTGFTWYQNSTGSMIPTEFAVPFLLTGQTPQVGEGFETYYDNRYLRSDFLEDMNAAGYSLGLYSDTIQYEYTPKGEGWKQIGSQTINLHPLSADKAMDFNGAVGALTQMGLYRDAPWILKPLLWFNTDEINQAIVNDVDQAPGNTPYKMDDAGYYDALKSTKLSVDDDNSGQNGSFRFIHLLGTHVPYVLGEDGKVAADGTATLETQAIGSMKMVSEYIDQLKQIGQYDNTTIVVTADHGEWYFTDTPIDHTSVPIMLVKPAQSADADAQPLQVSHVPVSHMDFQATILKAMGADYSKYGTPMDEVTDAPRTRYYYMTTHVNGHDGDCLKWEIDGDALDFSTWHLTGDKWTVRNAIGRWGDDYEKFDPAVGPEKRDK